MNGTLMTLATRASSTALGGHGRSRKELRQLSFRLGLDDLPGRAGEAELTLLLYCRPPKPLITQVRALVDSKGGNWKPAILAGVRYSLANALVVEGLWSDENEPLLESVELYRKVLERWTRTHWALSWATTQMNLRLVLGILGKQEASSAPLDEIVHLYRELLNGCIRERDPFYWATTKANLGLL